MGTETSNQPDVVLTSVSKHFITKKGVRVDAVREIDLSVRRGEFFCIVGPSGCGKTTLLKIICGKLKPDSGNMRLNEERANAGIATISQNVVLLPWRTLKQNIALGIEARNKIRKADLKRIDLLIQEYGLEGFEDAYPEELSGGMNQRAAIIRALVAERGFLVCDEPFSSIDFVTRLELNRKFKEKCFDLGSTVCFVTHNIDEAITLGDRVAVMSGRPGTIKAVYDRPLALLEYDDPVQMRQTSEFRNLFAKIWKDLKPYEA